MQREFVLSLGIGSLVRELGLKTKDAVLDMSRPRKPHRLDDKRSGAA
jgi:hypothetical protein